MIITKQITTGETGGFNSALNVTFFSILVGLMFGLVMVTVVGYANGIACTKSFVTTVQSTKYTLLYQDNPSFFVIRMFHWDM